MKSICIFLFSGTGMTRYVTGKLKAELEGLQVEISVFNIEDTDIGSISFDTFDAVGIAYPVHSFNAPKIVIDFAKRLPLVKSLSAFLIVTAGERSWVNNASSLLLMGILRKKGFDVFYERQFIMPANFIVKDDEAKVQGKLDSIKVEAPVAASEITERVSRKERSGLVTKVIAVCGRAEWYGAKSARWFYCVDSCCTRCGVCERGCPSRNIEVGEDGARFKKNCGLCMKCLYICPAGAIKTRRAYKFIGFDSWYENEELSPSRWA